MLTQNIKRPYGQRFIIQLTRQNGVQCGLAFDDFKSVGGHNHCLGWGIVLMVGTSDPLDQSFYIFGGSNLYHQINIAPINTQIQTACANHRAQGALSHCGFNLLALFAVQ